MKITTISNEGNGPSYFYSRDIELYGSPERKLSEQQPAVNYRLRSSESSYSSDWHVAGDPTLLIILSGSVKIILRNGDSQEFFAGDLFIAEDYLADQVQFDDSIHGHRAEVTGDQALAVLHLKLAKR